MIIVSSQKKLEKSFLIFLVFVLGQGCSLNNRFFKKSRSNSKSADLGLTAEYSTLNVSSNLYEIYVSPSGLDSNPGTEKAPLLTLASAQSLERQILSKVQKSVVHVILKSGSYEVGSPLTFDARDSGRSESETTQWIAKPSPGEKVVINAGKKIVNKTKLAFSLPDGQKVYSVPIEDNRFLQVYFGSNKGVRSRLPNSDTVLPELTKQTLDSLPAERSLVVPSSGWQAWATDYAASCDVSEAEIILKKTWAPSRHKISGISHLNNGSDKIILSPESSEAELCLTQTVKKGGCSFSANTFYGPFYHFDTQGQQHQPYHFENSRCFLDKPGEWFADFKTKELLFLSPPNFDPFNDPVFIPIGSDSAKGETIFNLGAAGSRLSNFAVAGLNFSYSNWAYASYRSLFMWAGSSYITGFNSTRDAVQTSMPAAINVLNAENLSIVNSEFFGLGADAISLRDGLSKNVIINQNLFREIAGQAVVAPSYLAMDGIIVTHNTFDKIGFEYGGGAVNITGAKNIKIEHNLVTNVANGALNVSGIKEGTNTISHNKISQTSIDYGDAGGIYTNTTENPNLSQHHVFISENVIQNLSAPSYFANPGNLPTFRPVGIYLDFSSSGTAISKNIIRNVPYGFQINCSKGNAVFNNRVENTSVGLYNRGCGGISDSMAPVESDYISISGEYENSSTVLSQSEISRIESEAGPKNASPDSTTQPSNQMQTNYESSCKVTVKQCWNNVTSLGAKNDAVEGAQSSKERCLKRAGDYANWCGNNALGRVFDGVTVVSEFYVNGVAQARRESNADGCVVNPQVCKNGNASLGFFYDNHTSAASNSDRCIQRAKEYHQWCANGAGDKVYSYFVVGGVVTKTGQAVSP